jgi:3-oxoacyl-[acyl-carrier protein] reductase
MDLELRDKKVLVAGASRGIGLAVARAFLEEGADVAITARGESELRAAAAELAAQHPDRSVRAIAADMCDAAQVQAAIARTVEELGRLDCAVSSVGSGTGTAGWDIDLEEWRGLMDLNFTSAVLLCQHAAAAMQPGGALALIGSLAGLTDVGAPLPYGAAKAALIRYTRDLAARLAPEDLRVNLVAPGNVLFPGGVWERKLAERREEIEGYVEAQVPMGRFGIPEEIASAVVFLCSRRASFITGACLVADGGQLR